MSDLHKELTLTPDEGLGLIWDYVRIAERNVLERIVDDAKDGLVEKASQWHSWKSGRDGINANNYGVLRAFRPMARRHEDAAALDFIARNVIDYCACFRANGNVPPGEAGKIEDGRYLDWDSDRRRHTDLAGFCDCIRDAEIQERLTALQLEEAKRVAWDYYKWIIADGDLRWFIKSRREVLRFPLLLNSLCAIWELLHLPEILVYAKQLFWWGWGTATEARVSIGPDESWTTWDTGWPWEEEHILGHVTDWTWYIGQCAEPFWRLWQLADDDPVLRTRIITVLGAHVAWFHYDFRQFGPRGDLHEAGDRAFVNAKLHGQMLGEVQTPILGTVPFDPRWMFLKPHDFLKLSWGTPYMRSVTQEWSEPRDGGYLDERVISPEGVDIGRRRHHQGGGVHFLAGGDGYSWSELFSVYNVVTQHDEDEWAGIQGMFDHLAFANHSGIWRPFDNADESDSQLLFERRPDDWMDGYPEEDDSIDEVGGPILFRKDQANLHWYSGAQGKSRGLSWMLQCNRFGRDKALGGHGLERI